MKEKTLLKMSLISAILGIVILFIISGKMVIPDFSGEDAPVSTKAMITRVHRTNTTTFLSVQQRSDTDVVLFKSTNVPVREGDLIEIRGTTEKKEGKIQIIADEIRILN
ncbi:MAG: OB-fold nucleic acid binding domain-containing protein [Candidatus Nanoarchaeia archaeon]